VEKTQLWATVSVSKPVVSWESTRGDEFFIAFGLVNDGDKAVNPDVDSWQLVVNGRPLRDWPGRFRVGLRDSRWKELPSNDYLTFGEGLAKHFKEPGIYRVSWQGSGFRSPEIEFRVMPPRK
jgi:hypothetical protein